MFKYNLGVRDACANLKFLKKSPVPLPFLQVLQYWLCCLIDGLHSQQLFIVNSQQLLSVMIYITAETTMQLMFNLKTLRIFLQIFCYTNSL